MMPANSEIEWQLQTYEQIDKDTLFDLIKLRIDVFVVEQQCAYAELDDYDRDPGTLHLTGYRSDLNGVQVLVAVARMICPANTPVHNPTASSDCNPDGNPSRRIAKIGRVITHPDERGKGIARMMLTMLIEEAQALSPRPELITLSSQVAVTGFYSSLGFKIVSDDYLEDGIPHIDMELTVP